MSQPKRNDTCYTCGYWVGQGIRGRGPKGTCHRHPPTVTPRDTEGRFPVTKTDDWCGEWKRIVGPSSNEPEERTIYDDLTG